MTSSTSPPEREFLSGLPRLKQTIEVFPARDGHLYLLRPGLPEFRIPNAGPFERRLLQLLDGAHTPQEATDALTDLGITGGRDAVNAALHDLDAAGLLEDAGACNAALPRAEIERFDRQLAYLSDFATDIGAAEHHLRLREGTVLVLGLGGFGTWTVQALVAAGVGTIVGVDGDIVESSNLNRQVLYAESDIGRGKASAAGAAVERQSSFTTFRAVTRTIRGPEDLGDLVEEADIVLDLADQPPGKIESWVNQVCYQARTPFLLASHFPPKVRVGPLYIPGQTACHACQMGALSERYPLLVEYQTWRVDQPTRSTSFAPACAVIGGLIANEATRHLSSLGSPVLAGVAFEIDLHTLTTTVDRPDVQPNCRLCTPGR